MVYYANPADTNPYFGFPVPPNTYPTYPAPVASEPAPVVTEAIKPATLTIFHSNEAIYWTEGALSHEALDFAMESSKAVQGYLPKTAPTYTAPSRTVEHKSSSRRKTFQNHHCNTFIIVAPISVHSHLSPAYPRPSSSLFGRVDNRKKDDEDNSTALFAIAGLAAAAIIAVSSYFFGKQLMKTVEKFKVANRVSEIEKGFKEEQKEYNNTELDEIVRLSENRRKLHNSEKRWAMWKTALLATTIAAAAIILVGAVIGVIPAVVSGVGAPIVFAATAGASIAVGGAILFAVGTVALFSLGIYKASVESYRKNLAAEINKDAIHLINVRVPSAIGLARR